MHNYKELKVWQEAMKLAKGICNISSSFPKDEKYSLTSQVTRSAVSIPFNIAEGAGRNSNKEFNQFLAISLGSAFELETQILLSRDLQLLKTESSKFKLNQLSGIQKMLVSLKKSII